MAAHPQAPDAQKAVTSESHSPAPVIFDNDVDFDDTRCTRDLARLHKAGRVDLPFVTVTYSGVALNRRLSPPARALFGAAVAAQTPSLINSENGPTSINGRPVAGPHFNENLPSRTQALVVKAVPGRAPSSG